MPKVTVAIPTHNRSALVVEALESVLQQQYDDREILVIDDGSSDDTQLRLQPYLDRIRYVRQENRGRAGSRNRAIAEASGEYVAFLDSDDLWLPGKLERQVAALDADPSLGMVHGHVEDIDELGRTLAEATAQHRRTFTEVHRNSATYAGYALRCMCLTSAIMVRRETLVAVGGFDGAMEQEDLDLYLRLALDSRIAFLDGEPVARYRHHGGQTGDTELTRGQISVCLKHLAILDERPEIPDARRARRNFCITLARSYHLLADGGQVRRWTFAAIRTSPSALTADGVARRLALSFAPRRALLRARNARSLTPAG